MQGPKYKVVRAFGTQKRPMKLLQMAKLEVSAQHAVNGDHVNAPSDVFSVPSAFVKENSSFRSHMEYQAHQLLWFLPGPSARLLPAATSGNVSSSTHMQTHFLMREEIEAESRCCDAVGAELGAVPATCSIPHLPLL